MVHENLLQYILENKDKAPKPEIQRVLLEAGWKFEDIQAAFAAAENPKSQLSSPSFESASNEAFLEEMRRKREEQEKYARATAASAPQQQKYRLHTPKSGPGGIIGLLMRLGVKDEQQANYVMIGLIIVVLIITFFVLRNVL